LRTPCTVTVGSIDRPFFFVAGCFGVMVEVGVSRNQCGEKFVCTLKSSFGKMILTENLFMPLHKNYFEKILSPQEEDC